MNKEDKTTCSGGAAKWEKLTIRPTGETVYICTACRNGTAFKKRLFCPACGEKMKNGEAAHKNTIYSTLPCKIGDEVFCIRSYNGKTSHASKGKVTQMYYTDDMQIVVVVERIGRGLWGERIFATEEEAQKSIEAEKKKGFKNEHKQSTKRYI